MFYPIYKIKNTLFDLKKGNVDLIFLNAHHEKWINHITTSYVEDKKWNYDNKISYVDNDTPFYDFKKGKLFSKISIVNKSKRF